MIGGMDVSKWQGMVPWGSDATREQFAFMKATEGALVPGTPDASAISLFGLDPTFRHNWAQAKACGMIRGAYHFARPDLGNSAVNEARWFLSVVGALEPGDLLALDAECGGGNWAAWLRTFLAYVQSQVGFWPLVYSFDSWWTAHGVTFQNIGGQAGLWRSAPSQPAFPGGIAGWPFTAIWQKASGVVGGDIFNGTRAQLLAYGKRAPAAPPVSGDPATQVPPPPPPVPQALYTFHVEPPDDLHPPDGVMTELEARALAADYIAGKGADTTIQVRDQSGALVTELTGHGE